MIMPMVLKGGGGMRGRGPSEVGSGMREVNELAGHSKVVEGFKNFNAYFACQKNTVVHKPLGNFHSFRMDLIQYQKLHNRTPFIEPLVTLKRLLSSLMGTSS